MPQRYSGNLKISVTYDDRGFYKASVKTGDGSIWRGTVRPAPAGFGSGIGYDSPAAYDQIASSAISFAEDEQGGIADEAEFGETGYVIRRKAAPVTGGGSSERVRCDVDALLRK